LIEKLKVPRSRKRGFEPKVFDRYKRAQPVVDDGILKRMIFGLFVYHNTRWERPNTRIKEIAATHKKKAA